MHINKTLSILIFDITVTDLKKMFRIQDGQLEFRIRWQGLEMGEGNDIGDLRPTSEQ